MHLRAFWCCWWNAFPSGYRTEVPSCCLSARDDSGLLSLLSVHEAPSVPATENLSQLWSETDVVAGGSERFDIAGFEDGGRAQAEEFSRPGKGIKSQEMCSPLEASERNKP